jgi:hypothetical protein
MSYLIRRIIGCLQNSQGAGGGVALQSWPGVYAGGSFQVLGSYHQNLITGIGPFPRTVSNTSWAAGVLTVTVTVDHLLYTGMWVELSGNTPSGINGFYEVTGVSTSKIFTVALASDPGAFSAGGLMTLWVAKRLSNWTHLSVVAKANRGTETGVNNVTTTHYYVPYNLTTGIKQIASSTNSGSLIKITTSAAHGFSTGDIVEISGHRVSSVTGTPQFAQGVWEITEVDADEFTLDGSTWPTGETSIANTGIVELHTNAVAQRAALLSGGSDNGSATDIAAIGDTDDYVRGYKQAARQYREWLEEHVDWSPGYYFSTSNVGTPYEVSERGTQGSYPFALVNMTSSYTNGWAISTSQVNPTVVSSGTATAGTTTVCTDSGKSFGTNSLAGKTLTMTSGVNVGVSRVIASNTGTEITVATAFGSAIGIGDTYTVNDLNLQLTLSKTLPAWTSSSTVRAIIFNHSNPSYGMDQFLDDTAAFTRIKGTAGTATSGSTTVLTDTGASFDYTVLGQRLHITGGTRSGESRTVIDFTSTTLTVDTAFGGALDNTSVYLCGTHAHPISSVSGANLTLRTPYRAADGTGGCVIFMGPIGTISDSAVSNGAGGTYMQVNTSDDHGLEAGDYMLVTNTSVATYNYRIASASQLDPVATRVTVRKVLSVVDSNSVVVDGTYSSAATGGWWFGTVQSLAPSGYSSSTRIDQPDYRRSDVKEIFNTDLKAHVDAVFARDGIRHIGLFDETSLRHASSAAPVPGVVAISGSLCGETSLEMIQRIGEVGTHLRNTYGVMINPNCTGWLTKDALSVAERTAIINTWGGITSEIACMLWDRSYYQMAEGWLAHINGIVSNSGAYYYQPQERVVSGPYAINGAAHDYNDGVGVTGYMGIPFSSDIATYPTVSETDAGDHNHSGQVVGIYGHSTNAVNGVHRIPARKSSGNTVQFETRYVAGLAGGSGGSAVWSNCCSPHKTLSLTAGTAVSGGNRWLVTTEFPHGIPLLAEGDTWTRIYGYASTTAAIPDGSLLKVDVKSSTTFEILDDATYKHTGSDDTTDGIVFHIGNNSTTYGADEEHWYGIAYMLWESGRALYFNRGALNRHSTHDVTHENVHPWLPDGLDPDAPYEVVAFSGTCTYNSTTEIEDLSAAFTDAVLGEQVAFLTGTNAGTWRKVTARTATTLTLDAAVTASATSTYEVGKTVTGDVTKVLELKRTFDGATKTVQVFPQKTYVTYTGFTWDTDA